MLGKLVTAAFCTFGLGAIAYLQPNLISQRSPEASIKSLLVSQIQQSSELVTIRMQLEASTPVSYSNKVAGHIVGETSYVYVAKGQVLAGIDLSKIQNSNILETEDSWQIELPTPRILDTKVDVERSQVIGYRKDWFAPEVTQEQQKAIQQKALAAIKEQACKSQILLLANQQAQKAIISLPLPSNKKIIVKLSEPRGCN